MKGKENEMFLKHKNKVVLDVACGPKLFWFNKNHPYVLYNDIRVREKGYNEYRPNREIKPDTTFDLIFECGQGTDHPEVVTEFVDKSPVRGFNYYYYVTTFSNGSDNVVEPGKPMESNLFWTRTIEPAFLRRA